MFQFVPYPISVRDMPFEDIITELVLYIVLATFGSIIMLKVLELFVESIISSRHLLKELIIGKLIVIAIEDVSTKHTANGSDIVYGLVLICTS